MSAKSEKILEMLKSHEIKTEESLEALQAGISHLQKKIWYYTLVNDAYNSLEEGSAEMIIELL